MTHELAEGQRCSGRGDCHGPLEDCLQMTIKVCQGGERSHQEEQEIQAHCQGSAEKSDKIERKFDVQDVRGRCCEHVFNLTSFVK